MVMCLDGDVGVRGWKVVNMVYVAVREERVAW